MTYSYQRTVPRTAAAAQAIFLGDLSDSARNRLWKFDEKLIGKPDYLGVAFFWNEEYKWWLRDASTKVRRKVHAAFLAAHLKPDESSPEHRAIIGKFFPDALQRLQDMDDHP